MSKEKVNDGVSEYLNYLFDTAYQEYNSISLTESELKSIIFSNSINFHTTFDIRKCAVKYCRNKAIMSHLFQESVLKKIAKDGHLLSPYFNINNKKVELKRIGIKKALTFPGFCKVHENMFEYEKNEKVNYEHELRSLIYKTICYNHVFWDIAYQKMKNSFEKAIEQKQNKFDKILYDKYQKHFKNLGIDLKSLKFSDHTQVGFKASLRERKKLVIEALKFKKLIWSDIEMSQNKNLKPYIIKIDEVIPICLSYFGNLSIRKKEEFFSEPACFIIHPFKNHTQLIFSTPSKNHKKLKHILKDFKAEEVWSLILSSLVYISDNWLINPDFYSKACPPQLKQLIETAISLPLKPNRA